MEVEEALGEVGVESPVVPEMPSISSVTPELPPLPLNIAESPKNAILCSCIKYLKSLGLDVGGNNAADLKPNAFSPTQGDIVLFYYPRNKTHHAAYVKWVFPSGAFFVQETNFKKCEYGERVIFASDPFVIGFIHRHTF